MQNILILLLCPDITTWENRLLSHITKYQCQIEESRTMFCGTELASFMRVSGNWDALAKLEDTLANLKADQLCIEFKRVQALKFSEEHLPYVVQMLGANKSTLIQDITIFFNSQAIQIIDLQTDGFKSVYSDTKLLNLFMRIHIPTTLNIADVRERFMLLCEDLNVDGILEPEKTIK